ncbi:hypothetical protein TRFO_07111 [Tritrichomonas foetus]|uniref:Uncharacterized protein n=1 Tax=Tritrichomonas foetus TaxID=1144522 RepID=A0A1J4JV36_9EUKA|nr:hypothetical protein TRFO_07111 [Tritrichomonas foetus]|eukprot:OHT02304.1 hypothetical protein TRFO_07111 [Tritrichomonas foetus]
MRTVYNIQCFQQPNPKHDFSGLSIVVIIGCGKGTQKKNEKFPVSPIVRREICQTFLTKTPTNVKVPGFTEARWERGPNGKDPERYEQVRLMIFRFDQRIYKTLDDFQKENAKCRKMIWQEQKKYQEVEMKRLELESKLSERNHEIQNLHEVLEQCQRELTRREDQLRNIEEQKEYFRVNCSKLSNQLDQLKMKLEQLKEPRRDHKVIQSTVLMKSTETSTFRD